MESRRASRYDESMRIVTIGARAALVASGVATGAAVALATLATL
jgi:hypothetical protein